MLEIFYPVIQGLFGSLAGQVGKLVFSETSLFEIDNIYIDYLIRIVAFLLMLNFNKLMLKFMFNSLQANGSTITVMVSFLFNNFLNGVSGYLLFSETLGLRWIAGMILISIGIFIIQQDKTQNEKQEKEKQEKEKKQENKKDN